MTAESTLFLFALAMHAGCWYCWLLVQQDIRGKAERAAEHLDAQANRISLHRHLGGRP